MSLLLVAMPMLLVDEISHQSPSPSGKHSHGAAGAEAPSPENVRCWATYSRHCPTGSAIELVNGRAGETHDFTDETRGDESWHLSHQSW